MVSIVLLILFLNLIGLLKKFNIKLFIYIIIDIFFLKIYKILIVAYFNGTDYL
uniref:Uncharacterized protein n=1 Tax=viral metagenome TaxID=1070528 RepID=A0A6C0ED55_9ZZZZ